MIIYLETNENIQTLTITDEMINMLKRLSYIKYNK